MSAHDSRVHFKLDEIDKNLGNLTTEIYEAIDAVLDARRKVCVLTIRRQQIAADVAIIREMLGGEHERVRPPADKYLDFVDRPKRSDL